MLSKTNVFKKCLSLTPCFPFYVLLVLGLMCLIQPLCFCPCLIIDETPTTPSFTPTKPLAFSSHYFPTLSDFATLPLFHPIFPCSSQCFNSIMDVHKAQFTSRAFSIISLVNSLAAPASPLRVFAATGLGALSVFALLTLSLHQPDIQPLWQITPICLCATQCMCEIPRYTLSLRTHWNSAI